MSEAAGRLPIGGTSLAMSQRFQNHRCKPSTARALCVRGYPLLMGSHQRETRAGDTSAPSSVLARGAFGRSQQRAIRAHLIHGSPAAAGYRWQARFAAAEADVVDLNPEWDLAFLEVCRSGRWRSSTPIRPPG